MFLQNAFDTNSCDKMLYLQILRLKSVLEVHGKNKLVGSNFSIDQFSVLLKRDIVIIRKSVLSIICSGNRIYILSIAIVLMIQ